MISVTALALSPPRQVTPLCMNHYKPSPQTTNVPLFDKREFGRLQGYKKPRYYKLVKTAPHTAAELE
jgi:hypothetical protein